MPSSQDHSLNAQKARDTASRLFPLETWRELEERIFIAEKREPKNKNQQQTLAKWVCYGVQDRHRQYSTN